MSADRMRALRPIREWFSTKPDIDEYTGRYRWWNWNTEWNSDYDDYRWRLCVGDIAADQESNDGEPAGAALTFDVRLWEDTGQFDPSNNDCWCGHPGSAHANLGEMCEADARCRCRRYRRKHWHDHSISFIVWRWGVYLAWRGGRKFDP